MSDQETREERARKMKRNPIARELLDRKGPFKPKVRDPRKGEYKRIKLDPRDIIEDDSD